jgi:hypothetical protein
MAGGEKVEEDSERSVTKLPACDEAAENLQLPEETCQSSSEFLLGSTFWFPRH